MSTSVVAHKKNQVSEYFNPMENRALQFSVYDFHLVKPGLTKHSLLVWMRYKRVTDKEIFLLYVFRGNETVYTHTQGTAKNT